MLPWYEDTLAKIRYFFADLSEWIEWNREASLAIAVLVPVILFLVATLRNRIMRRAQLESEAEQMSTQSRLPPETLERNRKEEVRYRKETREQGKKTNVKPRSSGPRFK